MKQELGSICDKCFANDYIPKSVCSFSRNNRIPEEERAQKVTDSLLSQIEYDTTVYHGFCEIIKQYDPWTSKLTEILEDTYGDFKPTVVADETNNKQTLIPMDETKNKADSSDITITDSFVCPYCGECTLHQYFLVNAGCPKEPTEENTKFPFLDTSNLSADDKIDLEARLIFETSNIMLSYSNFTVVIRDLLDGRVKDLLNEKVDLWKVKDSVLSLGAFKNNIGVKLLGIRDNQKIEAATCVPEVFAILRSYTSFFNYQIIEILIEQYGTDKDRESLGQYVCKLKDFCKRSVFEIPSKVFHSESRLAANVLVFKCTKDIKTLEDIKGTRDKFAKILDLQSSALQLKSIKEGCVELHFIISPTVADHIVPRLPSKKSYFKEIGISAIYSINSQTVVAIYSIKSQTVMATHDVEGNGSSGLGNSTISKYARLHYGFKPPVHVMIYKKHKTTFEGLVDDRTEDVVPKLQDKGILSLSEEDKRAALNSNVSNTDKKAILQSIKKAMREKVESVSAGKDNFRKILEVFSFLRCTSTKSVQCFLSSDSDVDKIVQEFEFELYKCRFSTKRRDSLDSQFRYPPKKKQTTASYTASKSTTCLNPDSAQKTTISAENSLHVQDSSKQTARKRCFSDPTSTARLSSAKTSTFQYGERKTPYKTQLKLSSPLKQLSPLKLPLTFPSHDSLFEDLIEPKLHSCSYQQPMETSTPEHPTFVSQSSQHFIQETSTPEHPTFVSQSSQHFIKETSTPEHPTFVSQSSQHCIRVLGTTIIGEEENFAGTDKQFSLLKNSYKCLVQQYQQEKVQLKKEMQRLQQQAMEEREYLLKVNKDLIKQVMERKNDIAKLEKERKVNEDLTKQVKKLEKDKIITSLSLRRWHSLPQIYTPYSKKDEELESKQKEDKETYDQI